jgi:multidrug efflux pump subunit AcrB
MHLSYEPGDLVNEVTSFGSRTPVDVQIVGNNIADTTKQAEKVLAKLKEVPLLRDVQLVQSQHYPTIEINIDRERAATMNLSARTISNRILMLHEGRIYSEGPTAEILESADPVIHRFVNGISTPQKPE